jgi:SAM-dependent methyltransferase
MAEVTGPARSEPTTAEPASFRDPDSAVFYADDLILRGLSQRAAQDWAQLEKTTFFPALVAAGKVVATEAFVADEAPLSPRGTPWSQVLKHQRVPVVSYPYEWPFAMLRQAATLQLDVLAAALDEGMSLKDGTGYNVQFFGSRPVFVDIGSFEPARGPWPGYRQFCQTQLFPLLVQAHLGVPFQPFLRGSLDGLRAGDVAGMFRGLARFRKGVLRNVALHSMLEQRVKSSSQGVEQRISKAGYGSELAKAVARNLRKLVQGLEVGKRASTWSDYRDTCSYSEADAQAKQAFVRAALEGATQLVLDLGANDGAYSLLAAEHADYVVAVDGDEAVIDRLYGRLHAESRENVLPLVMDLVDPSGGLGWRNEERAPFVDRVRPDVSLALALVHHLTIGANVPLPQVVDWLLAFGGRLVVEFVHLDDPMVARLLANKPPGLFDDYDRRAFETLLAERGTIERSQTLPGATRTLYLVHPR